jgi:flavin-dependent dehydrogenase
MSRALIVGGGPAGAAAALVLALEGKSHLLIERHRETQDALCGGFLSWRTLETLESLGNDADALNPARITRARLFAGTRRAEAALPRPALAVSRRRLDTLLLERAQAEGARIERGIAVRSIDDVVRLSDGAELRGEALFLASGKHDIRGRARPADARPGDAMLGLRLRLPGNAALFRLVGDAVELHLFAGGYAGLALQEDGSANLCMAVRGSRLAAAGSPAALLLELGQANPALGERLAHAADMVSARFDAVAQVPYGWRMREGAPGLFRLGDQAGVISSLAGEGVGLALASGIAAARAYAAGGAGAAEAWQRAHSRRIARPLAIAETIRAAAERPVPAAIMTGMVGAAPGLLGLVARLTRVR